jgi:hypothetical protein
MKDKKAIKRDVLGQFRAFDAGSDDPLPPGWLERVYLKELNAAEQKLFKKAVGELVAMGIVAKVKGPGLNLRLTRKGENLINSSERERPGPDGGPENPGFRFTGTEG